MTSRIGRAASILSLAVAALALSGCSSAAMEYNVQADRDPAMRKYATWAWHPQGNRVTLVQPRLSSEANQRIGQAIARELSAKSVREVPAKDAEVFVSFELGSVGRTQVTQWGEGRYHGAETNVPMDSRRYRQGALVVYISDIRLQRVVWRGLVEAVYENPEDATSRFEEVVGKLFAKYP